MPLLACQHPPQPQPEPTASTRECSCATHLDASVPHAACLRRTANTYQMRPDVLASLELPTQTKLFEATSDCGIFWVRADGRAIPTHPFDNGADYFCDGLTRYELDGKYGYVNRNLEVVVPPSYDFAYPFQGQHGAVCQQCSFTPDGEHTSVSCACCGAVDTSGRLVVALGPSAEQIWTRFPGSTDSDCQTASPDTP